MGICSTDCSLVIPQPPGNGCGTTQRSGGISRVVFATCSLQFLDITDVREWCRHVYRGLIVSSGAVVGQKAKDSAVTQRFSSCTSETTTGFNRSLSYKDFNVDLETNQEYVYYNTIQANPLNYQVGFITCDGAFTGFIQEFSIDADLIIPNTKNEASYWEVVISWQGLEMPKPILIPGLQTIVNGSCSGVSGFFPCDLIPNPLTISAFSTVLCQEGGNKLSVPYSINASYQWRLDGNDIPFATENTYTAIEPGSYTVFVKQPGCNDITSTALVLTEDSSRPNLTSITQSPGPGGVTITVNATGSNLRYKVVDINTNYATPWQSSNVFAYLQPGDYRVLVQNSVTLCTDERKLTL